MPEYTKEHETRHSPQEYWNKQNPLFQKIYEMGMANYVKTIPNLKEAFVLKDHDLRCIDERTPGGIHLAGSGILMSDEKIAKTLFSADIKNIWTHAECGAAKLYAQKNGLDSAKSDDYAREWGKKLAKKFGINYKGHLTPDPSGLHIARVAYYDATGKFDFQNVPELPPGFIISRKYIEPDYAQTETRVAISIATGDHGFGDLITQKTPLIIIPIADSQNSDLPLLKLKKELAKIARNNSLVIVDGFTF